MCYRLIARAEQPKVEVGVSVVYMACVKFTTQGLAATCKEGYSANRKLQEKAWESVGGRVLSCYYGNSAGEWDIVVIAEAPSRESAFVLANAARLAGGVAQSSVQELFTADDADNAVKSLTAKSPGDFRPA